MGKNRKSKDAWRRRASGGCEVDRQERLSYAGRRGDEPERKFRDQRGAGADGFVAGERAGTGVTEGLADAADADTGISSSLATAGVGVGIVRGTGAASGVETSASSGFEVSVSVFFEDSVAASAAEAENGAEETKEAAGAAAGGNAEIGLGCSTTGADKTSFVVRAGDNGSGTAGAAEISDGGEGDSTGFTGCELAVSCRGFADARMPGSFAGSASGPGAGAEAGAEGGPAFLSFLFDGSRLRRSGTASPPSSHCCAD